MRLCPEAPRTGHPQPLPRPVDLLAEAKYSQAAIRIRKSDPKHPMSAALQNTTSSEKSETKYLSRPSHIIGTVTAGLKCAPNIVPKAKSMHMSEAALENAPAVEPFKTWRPAVSKQHEGAKEFTDKLCDYIEPFKTKRLAARTSMNVPMTH